MAKKKVEKKLGITDIAAAWKAGWTPSEVNALLDRLEDVGDINDPPEPEDEDDEDDEGVDDVLDEEDDEVNDPEDEDQDESDEDEENNDSDDDSKGGSKGKKKTSDTISLLKVENTRLKKQIAKLQAKNRNKDVSVKKEEKSMEQSLIDTFNELY